MEQLKSISKYYKNKQILITGSSGFIAWNLIKTLSDFDCKIFCLSRGIIKNVKEKTNATIVYINNSYEDLESFEKLLKDIDIVFHLASQTSVYEAEKDPIADYRANVLPMQLLLEGCRKNSKETIIFFTGTSTQCGIPQKIPVDENVKDNPITTYDFHKLQAERWLKFYVKQGWIKGTTFRLTNVYGPGPKSSSADRGILNLMIKRALQGESLTVYGSGKYIRDYIFVYDLISVLLLSPMKINEINGKHYILGSGIGTSIYDAISLVARQVSNLIGEEIKVLKTNPPTNMAEIEFRNFVADTNSLSKLGLINQHHNIDQGIDRTIKFYNKR